MITHSLTDERAERGAGKQADVLENEKMCATHDELQVHVLPLVPAVQEADRK